MKNIQSALFLIFTIFALVSCGGGGSGGNSSSSTGTGNDASEESEENDTGRLGPSQTTDNLEDIPEVQSFQSITSKPEYIGKISKASLSRQNSFYMLEAAFRVLGPIYEAGATQIYIFEPKILDNIDVPVEEEGIDCIEGEVELSKHEYESRIVWVISYDNCETSEYGLVDGQLIFNNDTASDGYVDRSEITYRYFTVRTDNESLVYHGRIDATDNQISVDHFTLHNSELDATYYTDDLEISYRGVQGRLYHSEWGYVHLDLDKNDSQALTLQGADQSWLHANVQDETEKPALALSLRPAQSEHSLLETRISYPDFLAWPYQNNQPPEIQLKGAEPIEVNDTAHLDASGSQDPNKDFLTYHWEVVSVPEGCATTVSPTGDVVQYESECRGNHEFQLTVKDGFNSSVKEFSLTLAGPLPEVVDKDYTQPAQPGEDLNASVEVENASQAGPISYALAYGPEGISIDRNGNITGKPDHPFKTGGARIHIGVEVSNERSVLEDITFEFPATEVDMGAANRGKFPDDISGAWQDIDQDGSPEKLVDYQNTFAIVDIKDQSTRYSHIETRQFSELRIQDKGVMDYDDDGNNEIVLVYSDRYVVLSGQDYSIKENIQLKPVNGESRPAILIPGVNAGILYSKGGNSDDNWTFYEFASQTRHTRPAPGLHDLRVADFSGDGHYSVLATHVDEFDGEPALIHNDGSVQVLDAYPDMVGDVDGDGVDDVIVANFLRYQDADEARLERYNPTTGAVSETYTVEALGPQNWSNPRVGWVNLDGEPGDELVIGEHDSQTLYVLKRSGTHFEIVEEIAYPERGDRTLYQALENLGQFDTNSAVIDGSVAQGGLFQFSLQGGTETYESGFQYYSSEASSTAGLRFHQKSDDSIDLVGVRRWIDEDGNLRRELTRSAINTEAHWQSHTRYPDLPLPYILSEITRISSPDGSRSHLLYTNNHTIFSVVDLEDNEVIYTGEQPFEQYEAGDLDGDGQTEVYAPAFSELYELDVDDYQFGLFDDVGAERTFELMSPLVATFGESESPALFLYDPSYDGGLKSKVYIYQYQDDRIERVQTMSLELRFNNMGISRQDVTGDGVPEVILWSEDESTTFWVIDHTLEVIQKATIESPIYEVPNLGNLTSNNLIAFEQGKEIGVRADSRIVEVDLDSEKVITRSPIIPGGMDRDDLICLGNQLQSCNKFVISSAGVFTLN